MMFYEDNHIQLFNGDCRQMLELEDESVQMVITSPPYWGLRKYSGEQDLILGGDKNCQHEWGKIPFGGRNKRANDEDPKFQDGCLNPKGEALICQLCGAWCGSYGLEPTPEMYVQHTIEILREIRRVLRKDGVVFWNIGDSYASKAGGYSDNGSRGNTSVISAKTQAAVVKGKRIARGSGRWGGGNNPSTGYLKKKDLVLIPFRVAIAAQEDGWYVRSDIIWSKPNPMPESVTDRPTNSHEHILMLTKSAKYYWDADAVREPHKSTFEEFERAAITPREKRNKYATGYEGEVISGGADKHFVNQQHPLGRNIRSVWTFPTQPYPEAHFAVFPEKLPELCIKAATPEVGCCAKCGAPWQRVMEKTGHINKREPAHVPNNTPSKTDSTGWSLVAMATGRWQPTCKCNAEKVPSVVLDPFAGAGTTLWVAKKLNRRAVGYELSEEYCRLIVNRCRQQVIF